MRLPGFNSVSNLCYLFHLIFNSRYIYYSELTHFGCVIGLKVTDAVVLIDREQGGSLRLNENGIRLHSALTLSYMVDVLLEHGRLTQDIVASVKTFIAENQTFSLAPPKAPVSSEKKRLAYGERALLAQNPTAKRLFEIMEEKQSNLSLAADVLTAEELLAIADKVH